MCTVACREGVCVQERWTGVRHRCERLSPICPRDVQEKHDDAGAAGDQRDLDEVVHLKDLSAD